MKTHTSGDFSLDKYRGLEERFFGKDGKTELRYEDFVSFLRGMKTQGTYTLCMLCMFANLFAVFSPGDSVFAV